MTQPKLEPYLFHLEYQPMKGGKKKERRVRKMATSEHDARRKIIEDYLATGYRVIKLSEAGAA